MTMTGRPGATKLGDSSREAGVEYRLIRNGVVRDVRKGRLGREDVCDAHPELLRAARNVGKPRNERCPICEEADTVEVTYVFGARLPPGGLCPGSARELNRLRRRIEPVVCFDVEVCPECAWHHLTRKYPAGGRREGQRTGRAL
ncbi:MAG: DUF5318 family protein [Acidimicrobiales bacterium]